MMPINEFLFINKDAKSTSLTRSTSDEQATINSYVQRGKRHRRTGPGHAARSKPIKPLLTQRTSETESLSSATTSSSGSTDTSSSGLASKAALVARQSVFSIDSSRPETPSDKAETKSQDTKDHAITSPASETPRERGLQGQVRYAARAYNWWYHEHPSNGYSAASITTVDPFHNACITIDGQIFNILQYYLLVYHPSVWHTESRGSCKGVYTFQPAASEVIKNALESEVDMYAMLACMAARMEVIDHCSTSHATSMYMHKALIATQKHIRALKPNRVKSSEQILMIIFHLFAAEGYRDNTYGAKVHLKGAKTIVDNMGGLSKMQDLQMRELLVIGDGYLAAKMLEPCVFACEFDPGPLAQNTTWQIPNSAELQSMAPALRLLATKLLLPSCLCQLIDETTECAWVLKHVHRKAEFDSKDGTVAFSGQTMRWLQMRNMATRHRLLEVGLAAPRMHALRTALLIWILTTMTLLGLKQIVGTMAPRLQAVVSQCQEEHGAWYLFDELEIWILMIGAMSAEVDSKEEAWFVYNLKQHVDSSARHKGSALLTINVSSLQVIHERFFYNEQTQRTRLERVCRLLRDFGCPSGRDHWMPALHES